MISEINSRLKKDLLLEKPYFSYINNKGQQSSFNENFEFFNKNFSESAISKYRQIIFQIKNYCKSERNLNNSRRSNSKISSNFKEMLFFYLDEIYDQNFEQGLFLTNKEFEDNKSTLNQDEMYLSKFNSKLNYSNKLNDYQISCRYMEKEDYNSKESSGKKNINKDLMNINLNKAFVNIDPNCELGEIIKKEESKISYSKIILNEKIKIENDEIINDHSNTINGIHSDININMEQLEDKTVNLLSNFENSNINDFKNNVFDSNIINITSKLDGPSCFANENNFISNPVPNCLNNDLITKEFSINQESVNTRHITYPFEFLNSLKKQENCCNGLIFNKISIQKNISNRNLFIDNLSSKICIPFIKDDNHNATKTEIHDEKKLTNKFCYFNENRDKRFQHKAYSQFEIDIEKDFNASNYAHLDEQKKDYMKILNDINNKMDFINENEKNYHNDSSPDIKNEIIIQITKSSKMESQEEEEGSESSFNQNNNKNKSPLLKDNIHLTNSNNINFMSKNSNDMHHYNEEIKYSKLLQKNSETKEHINDSLTDNKISNIFGEIKNNSNLTNIPLEASKKDIKLMNLDKIIKSLEKNINKVNFINNLNISGLSRKIYEYYNNGERDWSIYDYLEKEDILKDNSINSHYKDDYYLHLSNSVFVDFKKFSKKYKRLEIFNNVERENLQLVKNRQSYKSKFSIDISNLVKTNLEGKIEKENENIHMCHDLLLDIINDIFVKKQNLENITIFQKFSRDNTGKTLFFYIILHI